MELTFHHIGVATRDIDTAIGVYEAMGYIRGLRVTDPIQRVEVAFMEREGHPRIELIAPADEDNPVNGILNKVGASPYHTCYEVPDLEAAMGAFRRKRFRPLSKPVPAVAFDGRLIVFMFSRRIGIVELLAM